VVINDDDIPNPFDSQVLEQLESLIHESTYTIFVTGAGISASGGIATFRGKTKLTSILNLREEDLDFVMPTYAHYAITRMIEEDKAKFVITSNHDNLHRKSGLRDENLAELFGNAYIEKCLKCKKVFVRNVVCPPIKRRCAPEECDIEDGGGCGTLIKTGVRYGQATPKKPLKEGFKQAKKADLAIVLGSSLRTSPLCEMPLESKKMIIVNLSSTPYDSQATLLIRAKTDDFMKEIVRIMDISLPTFTYRQSFKVGYEKLENDSYKIYAYGNRVNEPVTCFKEIEVTNGKFTKDLTQSSVSKNFEDEVRFSHGDTIRFVLHPKEEYNEPDMEIVFVLDGISGFVVGEFTKTINYV